ncbi:MAG: tRNA pseudouridine(38-40) synthase TruA [Clostridia bacterium]|nr:tRNA pseudouridine(38-40) synthase TruA [Clostridia bacterium]
MTNIRLQIAYDGTKYVGWQRQIAAHGKTVQGELEKALSHALKEDITLFGAGRTDTGVHAREQIANFHTACSIPPKHIPQALLKNLPNDIVIWQAEEVPKDFHARFSPHIKTYVYSFMVNKPVLPCNRRYNYFLRKEPDWQIVKKAALLFEGRHDFKAFAAHSTAVKNYEREITSCKLLEYKPSAELLPWQETGHTYVLEVSGRGFLYKMVRLIAGSLLWAGMGKINIANIEEALLEPVKIIAPALPAHGLCLKSIVYEVDKQ